MSLFIGKGHGVYGVTENVKQVIDAPGSSQLRSLTTREEELIKDAEEEVCYH